MEISLREKAAAIAEKARGYSHSDCLVFSGSALCR
jgi:hypothetical protein